MKKLLVIGIAAFSFLLGGCQESIDKSLAETKEYMLTSADLKEYLMESSLIMENSYQTHEEFETKYTNEEDAQKALTYLKESYLPTVQTYEKQIREIEVWSEELSILRDDLAKIYQKNIEFAQKLIEAFEENDDQLFQEAEIILQEQTEIGLQYDEKIVAFAKKYGMELVLE